MKLSASTNPPKEDQLLSYIKELDTLGVDMIHCDVMEEDFVSNTCLNPTIVKDIKLHTTLPLDVHFMGYPDREIVQSYLDAGANILTLHAETIALKDWKKLNDMIHKANRLSGIAINPTTDVDAILPFLSHIDLVLIMSVVPGKSGQTYIDSTNDKIKEMVKKIRPYNILVEVDGGINLELAKQLKELGVDIVVMGNALYKADDRQQLVDSLHKIN